MDNKKNNAKPQFRFAFSKENYVYMAIGVVLLLLGYVLLIGGGSKDPNVFNESLFNARRLIISPVLILLGLIVEVYAIMKKSKTNVNQQD